MKARSPEKYVPDPLYKFIAVDPDTSKYITDSELLRDERERAQRLYNLGLVRHFFPSASHSKWEHHLGTYHLIRESQQFTSLLRTDDFFLLQHLNFFSCFGYLALGYCSAEALLVAAERSSDIRSALIDSYLKPVYETAEKYVASHPSFGNLDKPQDLIQRYRYKALNAWFGAYKLLQLVNNNKNALSKKLWVQQLCAVLLSENARVKKAYYELATLEYLQRDLFYTQIVTFNIPIARAIEDQKRNLLSPTYNELLQALRATITREVYTQPQFLTLETLARERVADALITKTISIADLITRDDQWLEEKLSIAELVRTINKGELVLRESMLIDFAHIDSGDTDYKSRRELSNALLNGVSPGAHGYVVSPAVEQRQFSTSYNKFRSIDVIVYAHNRPQLKPLLQSVRDISRLYGNTNRANGFNANILLHRYSRQLLEFGFRQSVSITFDSLFARLQESYAKTAIPDLLLTFLNEIRKGCVETNRVIKEHDHNHPSIFRSRRLAFLLEYILYGGVGSEYASQLLSILEPLAKGLAGASELSPGTYFEYQSFLHLHRQFGNQDFVICPSVKLRNDSGDPTNELDFVILSSGTSPQIRLLECSINDGEAKVLGDADKMSQLAVRLLERFDGATVENVLISAGKVQSPLPNVNVVELQAW